MSEITAFISECVKNVEPRFLVNREFMYGREYYKVYEEYTVTLVAEDSYVYGYVNGEDFTEGDDINEAIEATRETIDEIVENVLDEYERGYEALDGNTLEIAWDALEIDESQWENGVIGKITIKIGIEEPDGSDYYSISPYGKFKYRKEAKDLPF